MMEKSIVWFITGASSGFGSELAERALKLGYHVAVTARKIEDVAELEKKFPGRALAVRLDVTEKDSVSTAVEEVIATFGQIDVLVNNAGFGLLGAIEEVSDEQIRQVFETNVFGLLTVTRAILPHMRKRKSGHILNITSAAGQVSDPLVGLYGGTKFAVEGISEALSKELAPFGIRLTIIEPGAFKTDFAARSLSHAATQIDDYQPIYAQLISYAENIVMSDPARAAEAMIQVAQAENPPLRIVLGADALTSIRAKLATQLDEYKQWESLSNSMGYRDENDGRVNVRDLVKR